jgi:hypothetical protein
MADSMDVEHDVPSDTDMADATVLHHNNNGTNGVDSNNYTTSHDASDDFASGRANEFSSPAAPSKSQRRGDTPGGGGVVTGGGGGGGGDDVDFNRERHAQHGGANNSGASWFRCDPYTHLYLPYIISGYLQLAFNSLVVGT